MKLTLDGEYQLSAPPQAVWDAVNDPDVLAKCIPGCKEIRRVGEDFYEFDVYLKVAAVSGGFGGTVALFDKNEPETCKIKVSGDGTLGTGSGTAAVTIGAAEGGSTLSYDAEGEVGGLVAGVGQRILKSVAKHLVKQFFKQLEAHFATVST